MSEKPTKIGSQPKGLLESLGCTTSEEVINGNRYRVTDFRPLFARIAKQLRKARELDS